MKTCFFVSRIGDADSPERKQSDKVLKHIVEPALSGLDYDTQRADQITKPGTITMQVYERLVSADLVIADLSGGNPNVFYELAVRHMTKKPFVQLLFKGEALPFDVAPERTVHFSFDVEDVARAITQLTQMVEAATSEKDGCRTMLSTAIAVSVTGDATSVQKEVLTEILSRLQEIQSALAGTSLRGSLDYLFGATGASVQSEFSRKLVESFPRGHLTNVAALMRGASKIDRGPSKEE
jgi:hypothetical protein